MARILLIIVMFIYLTGCNSWSRLKQINSPPPLAPIASEKTLQHYTEPPALPMPARGVEASTHQLAQNGQRIERNSLWAKDGQSFFKDQRAKKIGDILTVEIKIDNDKASFTNSSEQKREKAQEKANLNNFLNSTKVTRVLNKIRNPAGIVLDVDSKGEYKGSGKIDRSEKIDLKIAAIIAQILPNGNFVIHGRQQFRVNHEMRDLRIAGIIRPEDITPANTISYDKIAEARLSYGGEGQISNVQQPRYGQQILDILLPW